MVQLMLNMAAARFAQLRLGFGQKAWGDKSEAWGLRLGGTFKPSAARHRLL